MKDHYQTLGLGRSASEKQIKQAYRKLCKQYHPDHNKSPEAHVRMQEINEAHRVLSSPVSRAEYDQLLRLQEQQQGSTTDAASAPGTTDQCRCEKCGRVDPTLRVTVFTWVVSLLVVTYRHGWAKILCARCRTKYALLFDLQNFFMGWWGIPFGLLWTLRALWHNSLGGQQPEENNALFLAGLGYEFHRKGDLRAAASALKASLQFKKDPRVEAFYWQTQARFHETPAAYTRGPRLSLWRRFATGALHPALYCAPLLALLFGAGYLWIESDKKPTVRARSATFSTQQESTQFQSGGISALDQKVLRKAEAGNARAQLELASKLYWLTTGPSRERNNDAEAAKGLEWYRRAARKGLSEAQFELAETLENEADVMRYRVLDVQNGKTALPLPPQWGKELADQMDKEAIVWCRKAAEQGLVEAQVKLADKLSGEAALGQEKAEAAKWYRRAAERGNATAQWSLARLLSEFARGMEGTASNTDTIGVWIVTNVVWRNEGIAESTSPVVDSSLESESLKWCRKAAENIKGYNILRCEAQCRLAWHYELGGNQNEAVRWWRMAADQGDGPAIIHLADIYDHGRGVPENPAQATSLLLRAANAFFSIDGDRFGTHLLLQENPEPLLKLGERFESGQRVRRDFVEAYKWFDLVGGGYCWLRLDETGENLRLFEVARQKRDALSKRMTASEVSEGLERAFVFVHGWQKDFIQTVKAAENGDVKAQMELAKEDAIGVLARLPGEEQSKWLKNYVAAEKWYVRAASTGDADAQDMAGEFYDYHLKRPDLAAGYFSEAAEQGHTRAQFSLAMCYASNAGKAPDRIQAYKWCRIALAGAQGSSWRDTIQSRIAELAAAMTPQQIAYAERYAREFVPQGRRAANPREQIGSASEQLKASGSGFFISDDGSLVSNCHVVEGASRIMVKTKRGMFQARVIKLDPVNDIAILKVAGSGFYALPITQSGSVKLGDSVFTIGFPNPGLQGVQPKLTDGKVNSLTGILDDPRCFQVSIAVQPGSSGGALVTSAGNVVGIVTARLSDEAALQTSGVLPQNVNYAIKSSYLLPLLEGVPELGGKLKQPSPARERKFADVVKEAQEAAALVLVF
jgi:TPR repeat protein